MTRLRWRRRPGDAGQALVELALVIPMLAVITFACFQFVVLFLAYLSLMNTARDLSRWVAVHPHTTDAAATSALLSRVPPNLNAANLAIAITPACAALSGGKCTARPTGTQMSFTMTYDAASLIFLPTTFGCCGFTASIPTTLPSYTIYMVSEPT